MPYCYTFSYNDACNCHPEYREEECVAETPQELGQQVARAAVFCGHPEMIENVDPSEILYRQDVTDHDREEFARSLKEAAAPATAELERKRVEDARKAALAARKKAIQTTLASQKRALSNLKSDLTIEAVARRQAEIDALTAQLEAL